MENKSVEYIEKLGCFNGYILSLGGDAAAYTHYKYYHSFKSTAKKRFIS